MTTPDTFKLTVNSGAYEFSSPPTSEQRIVIFLSILLRVEPKLFPERGVQLLERIQLSGVSRISHHFDNFRRQRDLQRFCQLQRIGLSG